MTQFVDENVLSLVIGLPVLGALVCVFADRILPARITALFTGLLTFVVSLHLPWHFDAALSSFQFESQLAWIPALGISYHVGVDGLSLWLVVLTTLITPITVACSFSAIQDRQPLYYAMLLATSAGIVGVFVALDLFLFYVFWEAMLIPMYVLIGIWGGRGRIYATMKFVLYTMVGSLLMLVAILVTYFQSGTGSFDYAALLTGSYGGVMGRWLFAAYFLAFAIKVPLFPFHTWLPDAHVEAPTAGSVILAGVLLKMGTYGMVRFALPFYPDAARHFAPVIATLSVIGIVYGAMLCLAQTDMKKLVAYSSVSHLGFVVLGIFTFGVEGITGATLQMVSHGLSTGALFLLVGMIYERRHTRELSQMGGLFAVMPVYGVALIVTALSSAALPGTNGFVGEFMILLASFDAFRPLAVVAVTGVILSAAYLLLLVQRTLFGPITVEENKHLSDLNLRERLVLIPVFILIFWIGIYPRTFLAPMEATVRDYVQLVSRTEEPGGRYHAPELAKAQQELEVSTDGRAGAAHPGAGSVKTKAHRPGGKGAGHE